MTLTATIEGTDYASNRIRMKAAGEQGIAGLTSAADGTMSTGGIILDDPLGEVTIRGWAPVVVEESACTAAPRLFTGYVATHVERRGKYKTGPGREIDIDINDQNILLALRLIVNSDGKRPRESDRARLDWLLGSSYLRDLVEDLGFVDASTTIFFDEADYRGQYPLDVINDLAQARRYTFFAYWDQTEEKVGLFFDLPESTVHTSTLSISNVRADVDDTVCFYPYIDGERHSDPSEVYSRIRYTYTGGSVIRNRTATSTEFFPSPLVTRGLQVTNERVGKRTTAELFADRILIADSVEREQVTVTVRLPKDKVGLIDAGMRLRARFAHLSGFDSFRYTRVEQKVVTQTEGRRDYYDVALILSTSGLRTGGGTGGGSTDPYPHEPGAPGSLVQHATESGTVHMPEAITDGDLLMMWMVERGTATYPATPSGWTSVATVTNHSSTFGDTYYARLVTKIASGEGSAVETGSSNYLCTVMEWAGCAFGAEVHQSNINPTSLATPLTSGGAITPTTDNAIVVGCGIVGTFGVSTVVPDDGVTELADQSHFGSNAPNIWVGYKLVATPVSTTIGGAITGRAEFGGVTFTLLPDDSTDPPAPTTPVNGEIVVMDGASGTTRFPYVPGSLKVYVDNTDQTAAVTETVPECGDFTLAFTPTPTEQVVVFYTAA